MALVLNEEQQLLRDSAKTFLEDSSSVDALRKLRDSGQHWSQPLWAEMAEMGWTGIVIPRTAPAGPNTTEPENPRNRLESVWK